MADAHRDEIAKLESLYAEHPEGRIFTHLAEAYRKAGELEEAYQVLTDGIRRHPDYSSAHVVLGRVLMDQGRPHDAEWEFRRVLELDAHNLVALRALGDMARSSGRDRDALDYYRTLLEVEPSDDDLRAYVDGFAATEESARPEEEAAPGPPAVQGVEEGVGSWSGGEATAEEVEAWGQTEPGEVEPVAWGAEDEEGGDLPEHEDAGAAAGEPGWSVAETESLETLGDWTLPEAGPSGPEQGIPEAWDWETAEDADVERDEEESSAFDWSESPAAEPGDGLGVEPDEETSAPAVEPGVTTETIARVYARQGLYDRAADVYRELLRDRPEDSELRARLEEMEALSAEDAGLETAAVGDFAPLGTGGEVEAEEQGGVEALEGLEAGELGTDAVDIEPLPGLESEELDADTGLAVDTVGAEAGPVETGAEWRGESSTEMQGGEGPSAEAEWGGPPGDAAPEEPEALHEPWAEAPVSPPLGAAEEFAASGIEGLYEPWAEAPVSRPPGEAGMAEEPAGGDGLEPGPGSAEPWMDAPVTEGEAEHEAGAGVVAEPEPGDEAWTESPEDPVTAGDTAVTAEEDSVWTGEDWAGGEAESPYAWAEDEGVAETEPSPPIGSYFSTLLGWSRSAGSQPPSTAEERAEVAPDRGEDAPEREDDDDLEMFRSWLESLKQ